MAKILITVLASFSLWGGIASQDSKIPCNIDSSYETAEYIESHIDTVKELFIELGFDDSIKSVDKSYKIIIDDMNEIIEGVLLDFNDDNGYLLIGDKASIYDYEITGPSPLEGFTEFDSQIYYLPLSGYHFLIDGQLVPINSDENDFEHTPLSTPYAGQELDGAGGIVTTYTYVDDRYGDGYLLYQSHFLTYSTNHDMGDLSVYFHNVNGLLYTEGNCGLVAPFNVMNYFSTKSTYANLPDYTDRVTYNPIYHEWDVYYEKMIESSEYQLNSNLTNFPELYISARTNTYDQYGRVESFTIGQSSAIIEMTMDEYGYDINFRESITWGAFNYKERLDDNKPLMWSTSTNTYGSHTMAVFGYKTYRKATQVLWWTEYDYVYLIQLSDGWVTYMRYMDLNAYVGFAAFMYY